MLIFAMSTIPSIMIKILVLIVYWFRPFSYLFIIWSIFCLFYGATFVLWITVTLMGLFFQGLFFMSRDCCCSPEDIEEFLKDLEEEESSSTIEKVPSSDKEKNVSK